MIWTFFVLCCSSEFDVCIVDYMDETVMCKERGIDKCACFEEIKKFFSEFEGESLSIYIATKEETRSKLSIEYEKLQKIKIVNIVAKNPDTHLEITGNALSDANISNITFKNLLVKMKNSYVTQNLTMIHSIFTDKTIISDYLYTDTYCLDNALYQQSKTIILDVSSGIKHAVLSNIKGELFIKNINENINILFAGNEFILESATTCERIVLEVLSHNSSCIISNFMMKGVRISISNLFVSAVLHNFVFRLDLDTPSKLIMEQTSWEGSNMKSMTIHQYSKSNISMKCEISNMFVFLEKGSITNVVFKSKFIQIDSIFSVSDAKVNFSYSKGIQLPSYGYIHNVNITGNSIVSFDSNVLCKTDLIYYNGDINEHSEVYGVFDINLCAVLSGDLYISAINLSKNAKIEIFKPNGTLYVGNYKTNQHVQTVTIIYHKSVDYSSYYNDTALNVTHTDCLKAYKGVLLNNHLTTEKKQIVLDVSVLNTTHSNCLVQTSAYVFGRGYLDLISVCLAENKTYIDDFQWILNAYTQDDFKIKPIAEVFGIGKNITIYVAGNVSVPLCGISEEYYDITIIGLTDNAVLYVSDSYFSRLFLSNITIVYVPDDDTQLSVHILNLNNTYIRSKQTIECDYVVTNPDEFKRCNKFFKCDRVIIKTESTKAKLFAYDDYFVYNGINISTANFKSILFSTIFRDIAITDIYIYGDSIMKLNSLPFSDVNLYCYNESCCFDATIKESMYIHTNTIPNIMKFPKNVYFLGEYSEYNCTRIKIMKECYFYSSKSIVINSSSIVFQDNQKVDFGNATFKLLIILFINSVTHLTVKTMQIESISISPSSLVDLDISGCSENFTIFLQYYMGSVPFFSLNCDTSNVIIKMINVATNMQIFSKVQLDNISIHTMQFKNNVSINAQYLSRSWLFNEDTREFDIVKRENSEGFGIYIVKRLIEIIPETPKQSDVEKQNYILVLLISIAAFIAIILIVVVIVNYSKKARIINYVSTSGAEQLII